MLWECVFSAHYVNFLDDVITLILSIFVTNSKKCIYKANLCSLNWINFLFRVFNYFRLMHYTSNLHFSGCLTNTSY